MFRKPKKKEDKKQRQRLADDDEALQNMKIEGEDKDTSNSTPKISALLSFDHDEG